MCFVVLFLHFLDNCQIKHIAYSLHQPSIPPCCCLLDEHIYAVAGMTDLVPKGWEPKLRSCLNGDRIWIGDVGDNRCCRC